MTEKKPTIRWPGAKLRKLSEIADYPNNPRTHPEAAIDMLAGMMARHGVDQPIVVDEDDVILKGHGRKRASLRLGWTEFPVVMRKGLSAAEKMAMRIQDNSVGLLSGWDTELIRGEIGSLKLAGYDVALLGFGDVQLVEFTTTPGPPAPPGMSLAERFGIVPFSVFNAREGWWQQRKQAWIALGIKSEVGRGETPSTSARVGPDEPATYRTIGGRKAKRKASAVPGGSAMPAADYSDKQRGDGRGRRLRHKPNAIPGGGTDAA